MAQTEVCNVRGYLAGYTCVSRSAGRRHAKRFGAGAETQRQTLLDIVQERFPAIAHLAKQQADTFEDPEMLRRLIVKISIVKTPKEAEQYLLNPGSLENKH